MLSFAGEKNYPYPDFKPFTMQELKQHLALYDVNGLNPSPRAEMKSNHSQSTQLMAMILLFDRSFLTLSVVIAILKLSLL
jgi:hypothetical protein